MTLKLENISHICIILAALVVGVTTLESRFNKKTPPSMGEREKELRSIKLDLAKEAKGEAAVILMLSTSCKFCDESSEFYKRVSKLKDDSQGRIKLVTFFREPIEQAQKKLSDWRITPDFVYANGFKFLEDKVSGTPTVLLAGTDGKVIDSWLGKLSSEREAVAMESIKRACKTCAW